VPAETKLSHCDTIFPSVAIGVKFSATLASKSSKRLEIGGNKVGDGVGVTPKVSVGVGVGVLVGVSLTVGVGVLVGVSVGVEDGGGGSQGHVFGVESHTVTAPAVTKPLGLEYVEVSAHAQNVKLEIGETIKVIRLLTPRKSLKQSGYIIVAPSLPVIPEN
jgi:hypothetical protein